jgi:hypothetical protein
MTRNGSLMARVLFASAGHVINVVLKNQRKIHIITRKMVALVLILLHSVHHILKAKWGKA